MWPKQWTGGTEFELTRSRLFYLSIFHASFTESVSCPILFGRFSTSPWFCVRLFWHLSGDKIFGMLPSHEIARANRPCSNIYIILMGVSRDLGHGAKLTSSNLFIFPIFFYLFILTVTSSCIHPLGLDG